MTTNIFSESHFDNKHKSYYSIVIAVGLFIIIFFVIYRSSWSHLFRKDSIPIQKIFTFRAPDNFSHDNSVRVVLSHITKDDQGILCVDAQKKSFFAVHFPPHQGSMTTLTVDYFSDTPKTKAFFYLYLPAKNKIITLSRYSSLRGHTFNITRYLTLLEPYYIGFEIHDVSGKLFINQLTVNQIESSFSLPRLATFLIIIVFMFLFLSSVHRIYKRMSYVWTSAFVFLILFTTGSLLKLNWCISPWYWLFLLTTVIIYRSYHYYKIGRIIVYPHTFAESHGCKAVDEYGDAPREARNRQSYACKGVGVYKEWLLLILLLGTIVRWNALLDTIGQTLSGDASHYYSIARSISFSTLFNTGVREFLYPWIQALALYSIGPNVYQFRICSLVCSIGIIFLTYRLTKTVLKNDITALLASFLVAVNQYAIFSSKQGERIELFVLLMLWFCVCIVDRKKETIIRAVYRGIIGGCLCLTWMHGVIGVGILFIYRLWLQKISRLYTLLSIIICFFLIAPLMYHHWIEYKDPFISLNAHTNFYRNAELCGTPSYQGGAQSWIAYLYERGIINIGVRTIKGYASIFFNPNNPFNKIFLGFHYTQSYSYFLFPFLVIGFMVELLKKRFLILFMLIAFTHISPYWASEYRDPRLLFFLAPFFAYYWASGAHFCIEKLLLLIKQKKMIQ